MFCYAYMTIQLILCFREVCYLVLLSYISVIILNTSDEGIVA